MSFGVRQYISSDIPEVLKWKTTFNSYYIPLKRNIQVHPQKRVNECELCGNPSQTLFSSRVCQG